MTIEDGTGLENADSYAGVSVADSYHIARGNLYWMDASEEAKSAALIRACDYLERAYGRLWHGARISVMQRLSFPRYGIEELKDDEIPAWLIEAQCEAASIELLNPGLLLESPSEGGTLQEEKEGEVTRRFAAGGSTIRRFPSIQGLLAAYIRNPSLLKLERT